MFAADLEHVRFERDNFLGVASEEAIEEYKTKYPECLENIKELSAEE